MGDAVILAGHVTRYPYLYRDRHRGSPNSFHSRITSDRVPYAYRLEKGHPFHRYGNNARLRGLCRKNPAAEVHLRGQPSAENVSVRIGVPGHGNRLNNEFASRLVGHLECFNHE